MTRRNLNMTARRERILAAARAIVAREGFDALTTRRLADEAGVTAPTLYNLIGSKDEIISELVRRGVFRFEVGLSISTENSICEQVESLAVLSMHNIALQASYWRTLAYSFDQVGGGFVANPLPGKDSRAGDAAIALALPILERAAAGSAAPRRHNTPPFRHSCG
jgi:AcrR family transcriptional regulator